MNAKNGPGRPKKSEPVPEADDGFIGAEEPSDEPTDEYTDDDALGQLDPDDVSEED